MRVFVVVMRNTADVKVFANKEDAEAFKKEYNYWHDGGCYIREAEIQ